MSSQMSADSRSPAVALKNSVSQTDIDNVAISAFTLARLNDDETESAQPADYSKGIAPSDTPVAGMNSSRLPVNGHVKLNGDVRPCSADLKTVKEWNVRSNPGLINCVNPIKKIVEDLGKRDDNGKELVSLAQGDPVRFGPHMKVPDEACSALIKVIQEAKNNGYSLCSGLLESRRYFADPAKVNGILFALNPSFVRAIADYLSADGPYKLSSQDVVLSSGAGQALHIMIDAFRFPGCNIMLPRPGFSLYEAICRYFNIEIRFYDLLDDSNWEVDLHQVAALADDNTAVMIVCNPGNPCGSVFSYRHLAQIATLAGELQVTIIADEVYDKMVFGRTAFVSMATFSSTVPVVTIGGVSKGWLATGWRLGWLAMWDPQDILKNAKIPEAVLNIMQIISGPATPMQAALPEMLQSTPASAFEKTWEHLRSGAVICYTRATKIQGLSIPTRPEGGMFMMVKLDLAVFEDIKSDTEFTQALLKEESVVVLPGVAFGIPNWFRIVFALSLPQLGLAWDRIEGFCSRHARQSRFERSIASINGLALQKST